VNHRRSSRGYHSCLALGTIAAALLPSCVEVQPPAPDAPPPVVAPTAPWRAARTAVVAQINAARSEAGLPPLRYDPLLQAVGDAHCAILLAEGGDGHFSSSGVPPYLRWLLAGGYGYHMENVGAYSTTGRVTEAALPGILARSVAGMLDEVPPADGHRRALLDPWVTHIGVGLAWGDGEVRMTHELAVEVTEGWAPPPLVAAPGSRVALSGRLPLPWEAGAVEVCWQPLPQPLSAAELRGLRTYAYPPRRAMLYANRPSAEPNVDAARGGSGGPGTAAAPFVVDRRGRFTASWTTGPHEGVEVALLWARHGPERPFVPVAASATVVVRTGTLPPELAFWRGLAAKGRAGTEAR
jgi:uncharacterized protein YkwD